MSVLVADIKDYSRLSNEQLRSFFKNVIPDIAEILDDADTVEQNSWGDGIIAFFNEESSAVECAFAIKELFYTFSTNDYGLPETDLDIRLALHSAYVWEGTNPIRSSTGFVGSDIALAARIEPIAISNRIFATKLFVDNLHEEVVQNENIAIDHLYPTELAKGWGNEEICHIRRDNAQPLEEAEFRDHVRSVQSSEAEKEANSVEKILLENNSPDDKKNAIDILADRGDIESMNLLADIASDRDGTRGDIRARAAGRLDQFEDPTIVEALTDIIENDDYYKAVNNAIVCLGTLRSLETYEALVGVLEGDDEYLDLLRCSAAGALGSLADERAVDPLVGRLDPDVESSGMVRQHVVNALSDIESVRSVEPLIEHSLSDPDEDTCGTAVEVLAEIGDRQAIEPLSEIIRNQDEYLADLRSAAVRALTKIGEKEAINALVAALDDPSYEVRVRAIVALGELNAVSALDEIEELLQGTDSTPEDIRAASAVSIQKIGQRDAKETLIDALDDPSMKVRGNVVSAIAKAGIVDAMPHLSEIVTNPDETYAEVRSKAALAIGDLEQPAGLTALREGVNDPADGVQTSSVMAAGFIDTPESRQLVVDILQSDRAVPVRSFAAKSLGLSDDDTVAQPLLDILQSDVETKVASGAIIALGKQRAEFAGETILDIATDTSRSVNIRDRALLTLQVIPDPSYTDDLYDIITNQDTIESLDNKAMIALRAIGTHNATNRLENIIEESDISSKVIHAQRLLEGYQPQDVRQDATEIINNNYDSFRDV
jgi:HEAT repeat protein